MTGFAVLERISYPAPLGLVFQDMATGAWVGDHLDVTVHDRRSPFARRTLTPNRTGVWSGRLPGFTDAALTADDWSALARPFRVEVRDPLGRFLPLAFDADLPAKGLYDWAGWSALPASPPAPLLDDGSPVGVMTGRIPLFSAPARRVAPPIVEIHAELADLTTGRPAAWALVAARIDGVTRGLGLADATGRTALFFPWPARPRPTLFTSPPAMADFRWDLTLDAYYQPVVDDSPPSADGPPEPPDLADILAQLDRPVTPLASTLSPIEPLGVQPLTYGRPLTLRTLETAEGPSSSLFLTSN
ncbi:hypothetical protein PMI01_03240 [Caulobacter sp. AP07]|uniref:hypothetical protein n=1 Tax=Caulobacter sp. AP07 TaxID=1144304 RepID=UPI0002720C3A|nr:hypothetical protein [Caulobacter sp. AP07]EJL30123.1 hypothetical protein PMI01_03240 [Caulobacter sp. AP07]